MPSDSTEELMQALRNARAAKRAKNDRDAMPIVSLELVVSKVGAPGKCPAALLVAILSYVRCDRPVPSEPTSVGVTVGLLCS